VGFSAARSGRFSLFGGAKIGAIVTLKRKMLQTCGKPYGIAPIFPHQKGGGRLERAAGGPAEALATQANWGNNARTKSASEENEFRSLSQSAIARFARRFSFLRYFPHHGASCSQALNRTSCNRICC